ncbi:MAG: hypothetical protein Harvfovirus4_29 [Harvfovirus sp.]|uniref:Uncharacterized protein n=1 Tax=Harvfovirus sp. TaxID=2487768 RepID=A0A3G5A0F4_9VIRU|nr:MAG: hypothetical protein Harvfovirus4_29 [Harvfovirus sp.]
MSHKEAYEQSVDKLNTMFATTTILGAFATYGVFVHIPMKQFAMDIFDILYIILYILAEIVYFTNITRIRKSIMHIQETISSRSFIKRYLSRQPFQETSMVVHPSMKAMSELDLSNESVQVDINSIENSMNKVSRHIGCISTNIGDSITSIDWLIMSKLMDVRWKNFTLFGFQVENIGFVNRIGAILFGIFMTSRWAGTMDLHTG